MRQPLHELTRDQSALLHVRLHALATSVQSIGAVEGVAGTAIEEKIAEVVAAIEALGADLKSADSGSSMQEQATARARSEVASGEIDMQG